MTMCMTPNNAMDTKRPKATATAGDESPQAVGRENGANPKVRMLYENIRFVLESRKVYLDKDINLVKLSQMLYTNTTYLSKVVNKYFGCNLKTLLNRYRVEYAKELLAKEDCNMEHLPAQCGFISRSTFYTAFMRFEHMTPTDYRANIRTQALRAEASEG